MSYTPNPNVHAKLEHAIGKCTCGQHTCTYNIKEAMWLIGLCKDKTATFWIDRAYITATRGSVSDLIRTIDYCHTTGGPSCPNRDLIPPLNEEVIRMDRALLPYTQTTQHPESIPA